MNKLIVKYNKEHDYNMSYPALIEQYAKQL